ncbi:unannotated protein [freshwater metagenome]|uniref:Unannotated protein n=1 Tax=freshwater metagenome TaxID=449393 RepID=A0A6J7RK86_9ZZZZ
MWVGTVLRLILSGILFWSGIVKLVEPHGAREAIIAYRVFPPSWVDLLGWALPAGEVALGALLLVGLFTRLAALCTALLMVGFIIGISSVWIRGYSIDCGCFGGGGDVGEAGKTWRYSSELLRDFLFTGMAVYLVSWPRTRWALDSLGATMSTSNSLDDDDDNNDDDTPNPLEEPTP